MFHDSDDTFTGIFYQDAQMLEMYSLFPEVVMCDATYKLTNLRMPVFILLGIDGDGQSQVVAVYLTSTETAVALAHMLEVCCECSCFI